MTTFEFPATQLEKQPEDSLQQIGSILSGSGYAYLENGSVCEVELNGNINLVMSPFYYFKPEYDDEADLTGPPSRVRQDPEPRIGYVPVGLATGVLRAPNHLYIPDDGLFAAVNRGTEKAPQWETRYFPKRNIGQEAWKQANWILYQITVSQS